jgi:hypothetical protein
MRARLVELGYWETQLHEMTPQRAIDIIAANTIKPDYRQLCPRLHWAVAYELWGANARVPKPRVWWANVPRSFLIDVSRACAEVPLLNQVPIGIAAGKWRAAVWSLSALVEAGLSLSIGWDWAPILSFPPVTPDDPRLQDGWENDPR